MSLSKQQIVGYGCGGAFVVVAGLLGYMLFDASSERSEAEENLSDAMARFTQYNEAAVFPSVKSIASVKSNETSCSVWHKSAVALAARGDRPPPAQEEPSVFKQRLQTEVHRMVGLPGGTGGHLAASGFLFGFEQYLGESGVLPQAADVPRLAVQLETISRLADIFAEAGVLEVKSVRRIEQKAANAEQDDSSKARKKNARSKKKADGDDAPKMTCLEYAFELQVRPAAVVQVLNLLSSDVRFMVVKDLAFQESADMIIDRISAKETAEAQAAAPAGGRRRRRGAIQALLEAEEQKPGAKKIDNLVVDPELDAPILMTFTLAVYDFGRGGAAGDAGQPAAEQSVKEAK